MKIKVERSGGFAGISTTDEIDMNKLPDQLEKTVKALMNTRMSLHSKTLKRPKGSADYFCYRITIQNGNKNYVVELDENQMDDNVKSLIRYIKTNLE